MLFNRGSGDKQTGNRGKTELNKQPIKGWNDKQAQEEGCRWDGQKD